VTVKPEKIAKAVENFTIRFAGDTPDQGTMMMAWGDTLVKVPIDF